MSRDERVRPSSPNLPPGLPRLSSGEMQELLATRAIALHPGYAERWNKIVRLAFGSDALELSRVSSSAIALPGKHRPEVMKDSRSITKALITAVIHHRHAPVTYALFDEWQAFPEGQKPVTRRQTFSHARAEIAQFDTTGRAFEVGRYDGQMSVRLLDHVVVIDKVAPEEPIQKPDDERAEALKGLNRALDEAFLSSDGYPAGS